MNILVTYPHIYCRKTKRGLIILDCVSSNYLILSPEAAELVPTLSNGFSCVSENNQEMIEKIISEDFGYLVDCKVQSVVMNSVNFTTSRNRLYRKEGVNTLDFITSICIHLDNPNVKILSKKMEVALDFHQYSISDINNIHKFFINHTFPNLREIEIVSSISTRSLELIDKLEVLGYTLSHRTVITDKNSIEDILKATKVYPKVFFKIVAPPFLYMYLKDISANNIIISYWSTQLSEILEHPDLNIVPIIYDKVLQKDLLDAVLLNRSDILSLKSNQYKLTYNSLFNFSFMGRLWIIGNEICVGNQLVSSIYDFQHKFSDWFYRDDNLWFFSRNKKDVCKDCLFADLCPSVSPLEVFQIIDNPCEITL